MRRTSIDSGVKSWRRIDDRCHRRQGLSSDQSPLIPAPMALRAVVSKASTVHFGGLKTWLREESGVNRCCMGRAHSLSNLLRSPCAVHYRRSHPLRGPLRVLLGCLVRTYGATWRVGQLVSMQHAALCTGYHLSVLAGVQCVLVLTLKYAATLLMTEDAKRQQSGGESFRKAITPLSCLSRLPQRLRQIVPNLLCRQHLGTPINTYFFSSSPACRA
ncbi:hypothetical protein GGR57DRAFT_424130 [Xylariaceae sp. FL1272]|nr:hypothetical protein GGR57DRAFT_424130 [Xylariaceae sp. FL1272]